MTRGSTRPSPSASFRSGLGGKVYKAAATRGATKEKENGRPEENKTPARRQPHQQRRVARERGGLYQAIRRDDRRGHRPRKAPPGEIKLTAIDLLVLLQLLPLLPLLLHDAAAPLRRQR